MNHNLSQPVLPQTSQPSQPGVATCPMCHTVHASLSTTAIDAGADWRCARCGQRWDAERLSTVSAYQAWVRENDSASAPAVFTTTAARCAPVI
jgi:hypothetical protein